QDRLYLEERIPHVKLDRRIDAGQPHIGEERTKPRVGFEDAFKMLVPLRSGNVGRTAGKQRPSRRRSRQISAPNLDNTRHSGLGEERRRERLDRIRSRFLEQLSKPGELSAP